MFLGAPTTKMKNVMNSTVLAHIRQVYCDNCTLKMYVFIFLETLKINIPYKEKETGKVLKCERCRRLKNTHNKPASSQKTH